MAVKQKSVAVHDAYSRTLCICNGCNRGLWVYPGGVLFSETDVTRFCREAEGLKSPGEDMGVLLAVLSGIEEEEGRYVCNGGVPRFAVEREADDCCCDSDL